MNLNKGSIDSHVKITACPQQPALVGKTGVIIAIYRVSIKDKPKIRCHVLLDEPTGLSLEQNIPMMGGFVTGTVFMNSRGPVLTKGHNLELVIDTTIPDVFKQAFNDDDKKGEDQC